MSTPYRPNSNRNSYKIVTSGNGGDSFSTASDQSRMLPRQISTGSTRGTQTVGYGNTKIDGSNNVITLGTGITLDGNNEDITVGNGTNPIITMGKDKDNTFNFRVVDTNGIGIAQFGQFPDQSIALKVAQPNIEVSTAKKAQLVFDSTSSFTVLLSGTFQFPSMTVPATATPFFGPTQVIPHNAGYTPAVSCFASLELGGVTLPIYPPDFPTNLTTLITNGQLIFQGSGNIFVQLFYAVDNNNLYLGISYENDSASTQLILGAPITYYVYTYNVAT